MSNSKALVFILLSFIGGVFISSFIRAPLFVVWELLGLALFYSLIFFKQKAILVFGLCLLSLTAGLWRANAIDSRTFDSGQEQGYFSLLKQKFNRTIEENLPPPQSGLLSAVLLGQKQAMTYDFGEKLNKAGLRHITAVSGMHIVILSSILLWFGIVLGFYRGQAFYFSVVFLWLFILMIGFQPSAVRAGIMGSIFLFCEKMGRQKTADRALFLTGAVMLLVNPSLFRYSVGFQLSFLAMLGIIYLMPFFQALFSKFKFLQILNIGELLAMSLAAQVFVLPLLIYYFGQISIVSPLTNLLVVPVLPYLMSLGFLFVILGLVWQALGFFLLFPVWLILTYIVKAAQLFAAFPFSALSFHFHWLWLFLIYPFLAFLIWLGRQRKESAVALQKDGGNDRI